VSRQEPGSASRCAPSCRRDRADTSISAPYRARYGSTSACLAARCPCSVPAGNCRRCGVRSEPGRSRLRLPSRRAQLPTRISLEVSAYASPVTPRDSTPPNLDEELGGNRPQIRRGLGLIRAWVPAPERPEFAEVAGSYSLASTSENST